MTYRCFQCQVRMFTFTIRWPQISWNRYVRRMNEWDDNGDLVWWVNMKKMESKLFPRKILTGFLESSNIYDITIITSAFCFTRIDLIYVISNGRLCIRFTLRRQNARVRGYQLAWSVKPINTRLQQLKIRERGESISS